MERSNKRARSLSTEYDDSEGIDDWAVANKDKRDLARAEQSATSSIVGRPRRVVSTTINTSSTAATDRPTETKKSIRLTVKMPGSRPRDPSPAPKVSSNARDPFPSAQILNEPRASRAKKAVVIESESEEDEDEDEDEEDKPDDDEDDEDDPQSEDEDEDAEGESDDIDAGGDTPMHDPPAAAPKTRFTGPAFKPSLTLTPAPESKFKALDSKAVTLAASTDDEELSDLESENGDEDAEGEDVDDEDQDMGDGDGDEDGDGDGDSDADTPGANSRGSTPDVTKMTKRQRSRLDQVMGNDFLQLPMEPQIKKHLTAEEHAMRRAEMARRRKNLTEKRNEEEKQDTINRLLKKQAPKRRGKVSAAELLAATRGATGGKFGTANGIGIGNANGIAAAGAAKGKKGKGKGKLGAGFPESTLHTAGAGAGVATAGEEEEEEEEDDEKFLSVPDASPLWVRWVSAREGIRVGVPAGWQGLGVGRVFEGGGGAWRGVEVVE